jgi:kynurenine formamidase
MCLPGCQETVIKRLSRRRFFASAGVTMAAGAAAAVVAPPAAPAQTARSFSRVVDLTHSLGPDFPTYFGEPQLSIERLAGFDSDGFNMLSWNLVEHTGTHLDAPIHFSADGQAADEIPVENLVVPLAIVDIAAKAADDPDAQVTPDDLAAWEAEHGEIPQGACVAMYSGWGEKVDGDGFRNADDDGVMHFPGFHADATQFLIEEREVTGIAVDTLSLDHGPSPDFAVHYQWLPTNRWGMECIANLADLPPVGATLVVGGPKIVGATGGPSRVIALV